MRLPTNLGLYESNMKKLVRRWLQSVFDRLLVSSQTLAAKVRALTFADPCVPAKFFAFQADASTIVTLRQSQTASEEGGLPIPPKSLWLGYASSEENYLESGRESFDHITRIVKETEFSFDPACRVLDFGCASGRTLRWFDALAQDGDVWGVDIQDEPMLWCQQNLTPPFKFAATTSFPHLPFEDGYFDVIYNESVFTHIADLADMWLLELRRILRPGGRMCCMVHDNHAIDVLLDPQREGNVKLRETLHAADKEHPFLGKDFQRVVINRTPGPGSKGQAQVFYDRDYLKHIWGSYMEFLSVTPNPYGKLTSIVLGKNS